MTGSGVGGDGVGVGEGDGDAVDPGAPVEAPSMEGFAEGSGEGVGAALPAPGEAVGEGVGEGEPWGSWASALVAATRLRTLKARARTIPGKGNTEPEPVPHIRIPELE